MHLDFVGPRQACEHPHDVGRRIEARFRGLAPSPISGARDAVRAERAKLAACVITRRDVPASVTRDETERLDLPFTARAVAAGVVDPQGASPSHGLCDDAAASRSTSVPAQARRRGESSPWRRSTRRSRRAGSTRLTFASAPCAPPSRAARRSRDRARPRPPPRRRTSAGEPRARAQPIAAADARLPVDRDAEIVRERRRSAGSSARSRPARPPRRAHRRRAGAAAARGTRAGGTPAARYAQAMTHVADENWPQCDRIVSRESTRGGERWQHGQQRGTAEQRPTAGTISTSGSAPGGRPTASGSGRLSRATTNGSSSRAGARRGPILGGLGNTDEFQRAGLSRPAGLRRLLAAAVRARDRALADLVGRRRSRTGADRPARRRPLP